MNLEYPNRTVWVTCEDCGWSLRDNGDFSLANERCGYKRCNGLFRLNPNFVLILLPEGGMKGNVVVRGGKVITGGENA